MGLSELNKMGEGGRKDNGDAKLHALTGVDTVWKSGSSGGAQSIHSSRSSAGGKSCIAVIALIKLSRNA
jgi:hypothetical protein